MKNSLILAFLALAAPARSAAPLIGVGNAGWMPPYSPMPMATVAELRGVVNASQVFGLEIPSQFRAALNELHPDMELDRRVLGAIKLPKDFSRRFQEAHRTDLGANVDTTLAMKALAQDVVFAYQNALPFVKSDVALWSRHVVEGVREGRVGAKALGTAADNLDLFKMYGSAASGAAMVQDLARAARAERTMDLARRLAAHFLDDSRAQEAK